MTEFNAFLAIEHSALFPTNTISAPYIKPKSDWISGGAVRCLDGNQAKLTSGKEYTLIRGTNPERETIQIHDDDGDGTTRGVSSFTFVRRAV